MSTGIRGTGTVARGVTGTGATVGDVGGVLSEVNADVSGGVHQQEVRSMENVAAVCEGNVRVYGDVHDMQGVGASLSGSMERILGVSGTNGGAYGISVVEPSTSTANLMSGTEVGIGGDLSVRTGVSTADESVGAVVAMSTALLAHQLPPLSKFDGGVNVGGDKETVKEWLEQFELVAGVCRWDDPTKLVNLVTRLKGEAYAFYKSCTAQQKGSYEEMAAALTKRGYRQFRLVCFTKGNREKESVDSYAQDLRVLFYKAYPSTQQGSPEAEAMGRSVLASQFVSGLLQEIKEKVAGSEGDFNALLTRARFEEALAGGPQKG